MAAIGCGSDFPLSLPLLESLFLLRLDPKGLLVTRFLPPPFEVPLPQFLPLPVVPVWNYGAGYLGYATSPVPPSLSDVVATSYVPRLVPTLCVQVVFAGAPQSSEKPEEHLHSALVQELGFPFLFLPQSVETLAGEPCDPPPRSYRCCRHLPPVLYQGKRV